MNSHRAAVLAAASCVAVAGLLLTSAPKAAAQPADPQGVESQTRGAVHEAFAESIAYEHGRGLLVPKAPPAAIEELPPDEKPAGDEVQWISGYWSWDDDRNDFVWISGVWRVPPPRCSWVPGYWSPVAEGHEWVPGFWRTDEVEEVSYQSAPPETLERGPVSPAPSPNFFWAPGCWLWRDTRYVWRPGYWVEGRPDWIWCPAHYIFTPRGYIYVDGLWDYTIERRGVLFAPVYIQPAVYARVGFTFTPSICIDSFALTVNLFCRPRHHHYYFGDYYEERYVAIGIIPYFEFHRRHRGYDTIYVYENWRHRDEPRWRERIVTDYDYRRVHAEARPARTYVEQVTRIKTVTTIEERRTVAVGVPLKEYAATQSKSTKTKFENVKPERRVELAKQGKELRNYGEQRAGWEVSKATAEPTRDAAAKPEPKEAKPAEKGRGGAGEKSEPAAPPKDDKTARGSGRPKEAPAAPAAPAQAGEVKRADPRPAPKPTESDKPKETRTDTRPSPKPAESDKPKETRTAPREAPGKESPTTQSPSGRPQAKPETKETKAPEETKPGKDAAPDRVKVPRSPIASRPEDRKSKDRTPPDKPKPPDSDAPARPESKPPDAKGASGKAQPGPSAPSSDRGGKSAPEKGKTDKPGEKKDKDKN